MYCEERGLGALPYSVTAVQVPKKGGFQSTLMYQQLLARKQAADGSAALAAAAKKAAEKPAVVSPTGAVPPPELDLVRYPCGTRTEPTRPCPDTKPRPEDAYGPMPFAPAPSGGGSMGPITVSVAPGPMAPAAEAAAPRGFGMVEVGIAAGLALLLGVVLSRKGAKR